MTRPTPDAPLSSPRCSGPHRTASRAAALALAAAAVVGAGTPALTAGAVAGTSAAAALTLAPAASAVPAEQVDLADTAGILDRNQLLRDLAEIEFREPTRVAVFTERGPDIRDLDEDRRSQAFNGRVLDHARTQRPDWLSADGQKWADGLVIVAVDPDNRMLGVYQGEDRRLSTDTQAAVRDDGKDAARDARWTDAVVDIVDSAASHIGRPLHEEPGLWFGAGGVAVGGAAAAAAVIATRRSQRRKAEADLDAARTHLTSVTMDWDATEVNASTVPTDDPFGARLMERFRGFHQSTLDATRRLEDLDAVPPGRRHAKSFRKDAGSLRDDVAELDRLDDAIADANTFLNRLPGWEDAWDRQAGPLRSDLDHVGDLREHLDGVAGAAAPLGALESFRTEALGELESTGAGLTERRVTPQAALESLDRLRRRLTDLLEQVAQAVSLAQDDSDDTRLMEEGLDEHRRRPRDARGSILDAGDGWRTYWTITSFDAGYRAGVSSVESSHQSSTGSGTGYGSSGGSFSGSGSSGSF